MFGVYDKGIIVFGKEIAYYGIIIAVGMAIGVFVACKNAKLRGLKVDDLILASCYTLPAAIIGGRIYFVLFSLDSFHSFWEVFEIWNGGMAIYGGVIGGAIGIMIYCLIHKKNFLDVADIAVPSLILGQAIGRWGNFFNQEAYGFYISNPSAQWFPLGVYIENCQQAGCLCGNHGGWHLATFFYESLWDFATFAVLMVLLWKNKMKFRGSLCGFYFILYALGRVWIEALRMDSLYWGPLRISQFLSIILFIGGIALILTNYFLHKKGKIKSIQELQPIYQANLVEEKSIGKDKKSKNVEMKGSKTKSKKEDVNKKEAQAQTEEKTEDKQE